MQRWRFLVIRDAKIKEAVGAYYKRAWDEQVAPRYRSGEPAPGMSQERFLRLLDAAEYLANHIHEAPVGGEAGVFDNGQSGDLGEWYRPAELNNTGKWPCR
jgi:hypothetical protein